MRIQLEIILNYKDSILNFESPIGKPFVTLKINGMLIIKTELEIISNYKESI